MIPNYIFKNGLRYVEPYKIRVHATAKKPWVGKTFIEVMSKVFIGRNINMYEDAINSGDLTIKRYDDALKKDVILKGPMLFEEKIRKKDEISNSLHRHEIPVLDAPIKVIHETDDLIVLDKPAGIPVHPTQGYNFNTITEILKLERNLDRLFVCHRLDLVTSGIFLIAKNSETYQHYYSMINDKKNISKEYIARVKGKFPDGLIECNDKVVIVDPKKRYKDGGVFPPKKSKTTFNLIKYNPELDESIVKCIPETGRKHQIRIHLRNLEHPIINDPLYGFGKLLGKPTTRQPSMKEFKELQALARAKLSIIDKLCNVCGTQLYSDPKPENLVIFLHSVKYGTKDGSWLFETEIPDWADI